ncbi:T4.17 protein [Melia azedarach]|uniref:T4.17 protein n=1 Tax=Melia azedarach TaxID=155640 RepID=A0ACC1YJY7_MELAZ|nr:T4.17 protein [Melia azedarach]
MAKNLSNEAAYVKHQRNISMYGSYEVNQKTGKEKMTRQLIGEDKKKDVNELADAFIKNFYNRLRIEQEEPFNRYQKMVARGV